MDFTTNFFCLIYPNNVALNINIDTAINKKLNASIPLKVLLNEYVLGTTENTTIKLIISQL